VEFLPSIEGRDRLEQVVDPLRFDESADEQDCRVVALESGLDTGRNSSGSMPGAITPSKS